MSRAMSSQASQDGNRTAVYIRVAVQGGTSPKVVTEVKKVKMPAPRDSNGSTWLKTSPTNDVKMVCCTCRQVFTALTWKHTCRCCGRCFCSKCSTKTSLSSATGEEEKVRVCFPCLVKIDKQALIVSLPADAMTPGSQTTGVWNCGPLSAPSDAPPNGNELSDIEPSAPAANLNLPPEYLNSPLSRECQAPPPRRSEEELLKDDDEQLARALFLSDLTTTVWCKACGHVTGGTSPAKASKIPMFGVETMVPVCDSCFGQINGPPDQRRSEGKPSQSQPSNFAAPSSVPSGRANGPLSERSGAPPPRRSEEALLEDENREQLRALFLSELTTAVRLRPSDQRRSEGKPSQSQPSNFAAPSNVPSGRANGPLFKQSEGVGTSGTDWGQNQRKSTAGDGNSQVAGDSRADIKKVDNDGKPTSKLDEELQCPLCLEILNEATTLSCGHTFCAGCLAEARKVAQKCPMCRKPIVMATRSIALDNIISSIVGNR